MSPKKIGDIWCPTDEELEIIRRNMEAKEIPFLWAVNHNRHIGYGRMIQIIQGLWDKEESEGK